VPVETVTTSVAMTGCVNHSSSGARFTKYLMTILRLSYDNPEVTVDLRQMSNLPSIFSWAGFCYKCKIVRLSELVLYISLIFVIEI